MHTKLYICQANNENILLGAVLVVRIMDLDRLHTSEEISLVLSTASLPDWVSKKPRSSVPLFQTHDALRKLFPVSQHVRHHFDNEFAVFSPQRESQPRPQLGARLSLQQQLVYDQRVQTVRFLRCPKKAPVHVHSCGWKQLCRNILIAHTVHVHFKLWFSHSSSTGRAHNWIRFAMSACSSDKNHQFATFCGTAHLELQFYYCHHFRTEEIWCFADSLFLIKQSLNGVTIFPVCRFFLNIYIIVESELFLCS